MNKTRETCYLKHAFSNGFHMTISEKKTNLIWTSTKNDIKCAILIIKR